MQWAKFRITLASSLLLGSADTHGQRPTENTSVRDSTGIAIAEVAGPRCKASDPWRLSDSPAVDISTTDGDQAFDWDENGCGVGTLLVTAADGHLLVLEHARQVTPTPAGTSYNATNSTPAGLYVSAAIPSRSDRKCLRTPLLRIRIAPRPWL